MIPRIGKDLIANRRIVVNFQIVLWRLRVLKSNINHRDRKISLLDSYWIFVSRKFDIYRNGEDLDYEI